MIDFAGVKAWSIPDGVVTKTADAGKTLWEAIKFTNQVPISIGTDKKIYNGGLGYKTGYRVRSGGLEATMNNAMCTGYIPFKKGDILRINPSFSNRNTDNAINFIDASFNNLGQRCDNGGLYGICAESNSGWGSVRTNVDGCTVIDISGVTNGNDIAYVRITHCYYPGGTTGSFNYVRDPKDLIITVNEEIT